MGPREACPTARECLLAGGPARMQSYPCWQAGLPDCLRGRKYYHHPKATEPIGAVVETGGVLVGKITSVVEKSLGGGKKDNSLVLAEDNGTTKIIPLDNTVKCLDSAFNVLTLNQLKGKKVAVEVSQEGGKATKVQELK